MERHICSCCGAELRKNGDRYDCPYCEASFEDDFEERAALRLEDVIRKAKLEKLSNAKKVLYDATHQKYPSKDSVLSACRAVLAIDPNDELAKIYLHSHDRDPYELNAFLNGLTVEKAQADEIFRWLLPSLHPRTVSPLKDFVSRHYEGKELTEKLTALEDEAGKISEGLYEPSLSRDAFIAYSSADMRSVVEVVEALEQNGFLCFAAYRNLRHGKGSSESYLPELKAAIRACKVFVFVSSNNSRSVDCDALKVELPYLVSECPGKPRIEYVIEDYSGFMPAIVRRNLKEAFPSQEHCRDLEDLIFRVEKLVSLPVDDSPNATKDQPNPAPMDAEAFLAAMEKAEKLRKEKEEARRKAEEEAKRKAELSRLLFAFENIALMKYKAEEKAKRRAEEQARRKAEEEKRKAAEKAAFDAVPAIEVEGDYLYYGEYPQSEADFGLFERGKVAKIAPSSDGYIHYEGKRYAKVGNRFYLVEPIKWRILKKKGPFAEVISDVLDVHRFDASTHNYADSEVRRWLTNEFFKQAFPDGGKSLLPGPTEVWGDKVYLPSKADVENASYEFRSYGDRQCKPTAYANARGNNRCGWYWTRTPYEKDASSAYSVNYAGNVLWSRVDYDNLCVRPCLRLKIA